MIEITPFSNHCYVNDYSDTDGLIDVVKSVQAQDPAEIQFSNRGGWQSPAFGRTDHSKFDKVIDDIVSLLQPIYLDFGFDRQPTISNYWFNVNSRYSYNLQHTHPGSLFSAVLYLKVPANSGNLTLSRPDQQQNFFQSDRVTDKTLTNFVIEPYANLLVAFPSNIPHYVEQNLSEEDDHERISIAFNFK
jgi:uncharacterized protein (TIGR02466 family)